MNLFQIDKNEIDTIFTTYQQRTTSEEIDYIQTEHEGISGLAKKLNSDLGNGISSNEDSKRLRRDYFDDNVRYREPMPSFWHYVSEAFEEDVYDAISMETCIAKRNTDGAPGPEAMAREIAACRKLLDER